MKKRNAPFMIACILSILVVAGMGALLFSSVKVVEVDVTTEMSPSEGGAAAAEEKTVIAESEEEPAASAAEPTVSETVSAVSETASAVSEAASAASEAVSAASEAESAISETESAASAAESTESTSSKKKNKKKKSAESKAEAAKTAESAAEPADFMAAQIARTKNDPVFWADCPPRDVQLLTPNPFSRGGEPLTAINTLVIHYVGNAGTSAMENRMYFEELKDTQITSASSHFIIGLDGEIVQCIPLSEVAYASKERNADTISIECCHPEEDGKFNYATYASLVELSAFLCKSFDINPQEIIRHYDVTGKLCPLYYVEHEDEWQELKDRIEARTDEMRAAASDSAG